jgi:Methyltransferase domain
MAPHPGEAILDVGCGTGPLDRLLARRLGDANPITAIDMNPCYLKEAEAFAAEEGRQARFAFCRAAPRSCRSPMPRLGRSFLSPCSRSATPIAQSPRWCGLPHRPGGSALSSARSICRNGGTSTYPSRSAGMVAAQIHDGDDRPEPRQHVGYRKDNGALLGLTHCLFHRSTIWGKRAQPAYPRMNPARSADGSAAVST